MIASLLRICALLLATLSVLRAGAAPTRQLTIFDRTPKTIVFVTNSHMGGTQLQELLDRMGYSHLKVKIHRGHSTYLNYKTGEATQWPAQDWSKEGKPVIILATLGPGASKAAAEKPEESGSWAVRDNNAELALARKLALDNGASEVFYASYHWHPRPGERDPVPGSTVEPASWVAPYNAFMGLPLAVDCLVPTRAAFPYTVGPDRYHANNLANLIRAQQHIRMMLAYDGNTTLQAPDLSDDLVNAKKKAELITVALDPPPPWRVGQKVTISWKTDPEIIDKVVLWYFPAGDSNGRLLDVVPVEPASYTWTIPAQLAHHPNHTDRLPSYNKGNKTYSPARDAVQIQVHNAGKGGEFGASPIFSITAPE